MKRRPAKSERKTRALGKSRQPPDERVREQADQPPRAPSRASAMRLAAEVDALAAQLEASRARIADLEARVDIDPLTDTLNRRGFERELARSLAYVKRYRATAALIYLDLDDFKPVNDRHGHAAGDAVLKAIAGILVRHVRASDVVARLGSDDFAVLVLDAAEETEDVITPRLRARVKKYNADHPKARLAINMGVARYDSASPPIASELLARAVERRQHGGQRAD